MERFEVNQRLLDLYPDPAYLEIGVSHGLTFHGLRAGRKVAVDPLFQFDLKAARTANPGATYHQVPSDEYFTRVRHPDERFDLIFVDGLHTFDQTLRDLLNATSCLTPTGVIVIDDVMPISYAASLPDFDSSFALRQSTGDSNPAWMGDVYRLIFFIRDYLAAFSYATIAENHGQTVLWPLVRPHTVAPRNVEAIARLGYVDAVLERDAFNVRSFDEIEADVRRFIAG